MLMFAGKATVYEKNNGEVNDFYFVDRGIGGLQNRMRLPDALRVLFRYDSALMLECDGGEKQQHDNTIAPKH